jgi:hypothetical protein
MNLQELKKLAEVKNLKTEEMIAKHGFRHIGIQSKHVWHWFYMFDDSDDLFFAQTYSQNTGRTKKGCTHGFSVYFRYEDMIKKMNSKSAHLDKIAIQSGFKLTSTEGRNVYINK